MESKLRLAPPSVRVLVTETLLMVGVNSMGSTLEVVQHLRWSLESKVMAYCDHLRGHTASSLGRAAFTSRANYLKIRWEAGA